jgi:CheY-like chemotaxis protein
MVERIGILLTLENGNKTSVSVALDEVIAEAVERRREAAARAGVALTMQVAPELPPVTGDPYQLQAAIDALVENGIKFTPAGGLVQVEAYIGVDADTDSSLLCLTVTDTGIGIAEEKLKRLFSGFYQADGSATRRYGGLGIGLTVAKAVVESHEGEIEVESEPGRGSSFTIKLPLLSPEAAAETSQAPRLQRVLIVDDEVNVALFLQAALEGLPHCDVEIAISGEQALRLFEQRRFDLLITDYRIPGTDGLALATEVHDRYPQTVVIMITAYADDALHRSAARVAVRRVLDKPVKLRDIRALASEALGRAQDS